MTAMPVHQRLPIDTPHGAECHYGHRLHSRNTALDMTGALICLSCVAMVGDSQTRITGRLVAIMLDLATFPTRKEVYSS